MIRKLKIQEKILFSIHKERKVIPQLTLQGNWLDQAGFSPGGNVEIEVRSNELIMKIRRD